MLSTTEWIVLLTAVVVGAIMVMALISARTQRRRHAELVRRFGPEYDREVAHYGSVTRAERELLAREKRVQKRKLRARPKPNAPSSTRIGARSRRASWMTPRARCRPPIV